jgi:hypothetical protein
MHTSHAARTEPTKKNPRNAERPWRSPLLLGLSLALWACTPPNGQGSSGATLGQTCAQEVMVVCPAGQVDGCSTGATKVHECVPVPNDAQCIDIRTALVKCKDGEEMTHAGCPEPDYMQRCAPSLSGPIAKPAAPATAAPTTAEAGSAAPATTAPTTAAPGTGAPTTATPGTPAPASTEIAPAPGTPAPAPAPGGGACLDIRAALVKCKDGERPSHAGCPGPDYMQRCAPIAPK